MEIYIYIDARRDVYLFFGIRLDMMVTTFVIT